MQSLGSNLKCFQNQLLLNSFSFSLFSDSFGSLEVRLTPHSSPLLSRGVLATKTAAAQIAAVTLNHHDRTSTSNSPNDNFESQTKKTKKRLKGVLNNFVWSLRNVLITNILNTNTISSKNVGSLNEISQRLLYIFIDRNLPLKRYNF